MRYQMLVLWRFSRLHWPSATRNLVIRVPRSKPQPCGRLVGRR
jgi:hypothetical protein